MKNKLKNLHADDKVGKILLKHERNGFVKTILFDLDGLQRSGIDSGSYLQRDEGTF